MPDGNAQPGASVAEASVVALVRSAMASANAALSVDDRVSALRWLDRAHRLVPLDPNVTLALASVLLTTDPSAAAMLFQQVSARYDVRQAWLGLAAARLRLTDLAASAAALSVVLSRHAFDPDVTMLAEQIADATGAAGWCALGSDGSLTIHARSPVQVLLDGKPVRGKRLPAAWQRGFKVDVWSGNTQLLGSPIRIDAIRRLTGCVEVFQGGIRGWAWHPGDPATAPELALVFPLTDLRRTIIARDESVTIAHTGPLARPRSFHIPRSVLADTAGPVHILGLDGHDLPGSPLNPFADEPDGVATSVGASPPGPQGDPDETSGVAAWVAAQPAIAGEQQRPAAIVMPVRDGGAVTLACLTSVMASTRIGIPVLVVDDASSDPAVIAALDNLAQDGRISLIRHARPLGAPACANAGIQAAAGCDVVLLDSSMLLPPNWLKRLRAAAYSARDIGTAAPLSNHPGLLSYPGGGTQASADQITTNRLDQIAERANGPAVIDVPAGTNGCLYLRRDCLDAAGLLRSGLFAQGPCQEQDFCLRARRMGWRSIALPGLFVGHCGDLGPGNTGADDTGAKDAAIHLRARNSRIIRLLHPEHDALTQDFIDRDPLAEPRRRIDLLRWRERSRKWRRAVILITHNDGGGVEQCVRHAASTHMRDGCHAIVLRPGTTTAGEPAVAVSDGVSPDLPNLIYAVPREMPALVRLLRAAKAETIEAHHLAEYPSAIYDLITRIGLPYDVHVHDYAWFCPRVSLVAAQGRYCGEPDVQGCEACVATNGHLLREHLAVAALKKRSASFLTAARQVIVPCDDAGIRMRRHFDGLITTTVPHEVDTLIQPRAACAPQTSGRPRICVVGAIGEHKGYGVLLACARDAAERGLDLEFIVVGHTIDDAPLLATGRVFVTGRFEPDEASALIARQGARLAFLPSIWPETWCLALGDVWRAGLTAIAFDLGAPAERIKRTGRGFLLPLGLSPGAINNALIAALRAAALL